MRRAIATALVLALCAGFVVFTTGAGEDDSGSKKYYVQLDNAFGLIEGADVKIAGVRAGKISTMELDDSSDDYRAKIGLEITKQGYGDLRTDVFCETRPQSLIGEYFVDCDPGDAKTKLKDGATISVKQTGSVVPVDLVNNIMRRPYRERFSILLSELGVALAGRGDDLNETIRRANPALRETDKVLAQLAEQRRVIRDLYENADTVVTELADRRKDVSQFVIEARDTARASAERRTDLARQFQRLPTFFAELRPTMKLLGEAADQQTPALQTLSDNSQLLTRFLDDLGPFYEASRPAFRTLASASRVGSEAMKASAPVVKDLKATVKDLPEAATNLGITLEHLDDPRFAIEKDPRSPRDGAGYTGLEAVMRYVFNNSQATNLFDANGYILKVTPFLDNTCAAYTNAEMAKDKSRDRCAAILGPNRPGINSPDPTKTSSARATRRTRGSSRSSSPAGDRPSAQQPDQAQAPSGSGEAPKGGGTTKPVPVPPAVKKLLDDVLPGALPDAPGATPEVKPMIRGESLLDYLLAP